MFFPSTKPGDVQNRTRVVTTIKTQQGSSLTDSTTEVPRILDISVIPRKIKSI